jgi:hypothetical protein
MMMYSTLQLTYERNFAKYPEDSLHNLQLVEQLAMVGLTLDQKDFGVVIRCSYINQLNNVSKINWGS